MNIGALYARFVHTYGMDWGDLEIGQTLVLVSHMGEMGGHGPLIG